MHSSSLSFCYMAHIKDAVLFERAALTLLNTDLFLIFSPILHSIYTFSFFFGLLDFRGSSACGVKK